MSAARNSDESRKRHAASCDNSDSRYEPLLLWSKLFSSYMLRMIKDEKEEAERKEGMMKDGDEDGEGEGSTSRGDVSHAGTPRPDGGMTPGHASQSGEGSSLRVPPQDRLKPLSRDVSAAPSPARSGAADDTEMADMGANSGDGEEDGEDRSEIKMDES